MHKMTIKDLKIENKRVLLRVDFNVPMENGVITDDMRISFTLPTIKKLLKNNNSIVIISNLRRPNGKVVPEYSLKPVAKRLSELLNQKVDFLPDCVGPETLKYTRNMKKGQIVFLENVRFHKEEMDNDPKFARELSKNGEVFVNDAFSACHRHHASIVGVPKFLNPAVAGYQLVKEIKNLSILFDSPPVPFVAIVGGSKVSSKITVLKNLLQRVDRLLIGGGMTFTFFASWGMEIGKSVFEPDSFNVAIDIFEMSEKLKGRMLLPVDIMVAKEINQDSQVKTVGYDHMPPDWIGVDIGQATIQLYMDEISKAKTVFINGPLGVFEIDKFSEGTRAILSAMTEVKNNGGIAIIGGGDSAAAVHKFKLDGQMTHVSTGGGASLEFMKNLDLPGIAALSDKKKR